MDIANEVESAASGDLSYPLLGSARGGLPAWDFCEGKPDQTPMPTEPRALVQPGISDGKAVHFNAFYRDCHADPELVGEVGHPKTCGELRALYEQGEALLRTGDPGVAGFFAGSAPRTLTSGFGATLFTATQYHNLWKSWGLSARPDNFDELVAERYGTGFKEEPNPYPLPGEDPNKTNGGSGRLPEMFSQAHDKNGKWTGGIMMTCHMCHTGVAAGTVTTGGGSSLLDIDLFFRDMLARGYLVSLATFANMSHTRGTNNASDINLAFFLPEVGGLNLQEIAGLLTSGSTASMDTPAWWNLGHRVAKFVDGVFPIDSTRVDMVFDTPLFGVLGAAGFGLANQGQEWMKEVGPALNTWIETLKSPAYPLAVDKALAEQGAVLFHALDLWGSSRKNPVPRPEGNGSCASCHGAYSPRYVHDPAFLAAPELEGIAAYLVPERIIGTDPARFQTNNEAVQTAGAKNFFGYPETRGTPNDCGPQNQKALRGDRELGYLAPPLYGVWATAPYFHNGSVPNVWEVLKPSDRKPIWRRVSKPARPDQEGEVLMGYDTDMARAYDSDKLGWKYDPIVCDAQTLTPNALPFINCNPRHEEQEPAYQRFVQAIYGNVIVAWNVLQPPTRTLPQMEDRKVYNTHQFAQGNAGHEFASVLTDPERRAIIEYLKTL